jgi:hypothetical protein
MNVAHRGNVRRFEFEVLEDRRLLAGDVTAVKIGATLFITGDDASNAIEVRAANSATPGDGKVLVTGLVDTDPASLQPTSVNGVLLISQPFSGIQNLAIDMRGGNDSVDIEAPLTLKDLAAKMGAGSDLFGINGLDSATLVTFKGNTKIDAGDGPDGVQIDFAKLGGRLEVALGNGDSSGLPQVVQFVAVTSSTVGGAAKLSGGNDPDSFTFNSDNFNSSLEIRAGDGADSANVFGFTVKGCLTVDLGDGGSSQAPQTFVIDASNVNGAAKFNGGDGVDQFNFGIDAPFEERFNSSLDVCLGKGDDQLNFGGPVVAPPLPLTVRGNASFDGGEGADNFNFVSAAFQRKLDVCLGNGQTSLDQFLTFTNSTVNGPARFKGGVDRDIFSFVGADVFKGSLDVWLGRGNDNLNFGDGGTAIRVAGKATFSTDGGDDRITILDAVFSKLSVDLGIGDNDLLEVERTTVTKSTFFHGGAGNNDAYADLGGNSLAKLKRKGFESFV